MSNLSISTQYAPRVADDRIMAAYPGGRGDQIARDQPPNLISLGLCCRFRPWACSLISPGSLA